MTLSSHFDGGSQAGMEFRVLGPVQALIAGHPVDLGQRKQRLILAVLLLEANQLVPNEWLVDVLWRERPPPSARRIVQAHLSRLRTAMARAGADRVSVSLERRGPGYLLACDPARIDAHQFRVLLERARASADDATRALMLRQALALWRGQALADVAGVDLRDKLCRGLQEARLTALEERFDAELRLGHHARLIDELTELAAKYPYRQHFAGQLMLALHGAGRSADALAVYQRTRRRLGDELGLDPSTELRQWHLAILRDDPDLDQVRQAGPQIGPHTGPRAGPPAGRPPGQRSPLAAIVPAQLPPDIPHFTGRAASLALLDELLPDAGAGPPRATPVAVVTGTAGSGKTALAVHWAHRHADRFTGQLYLNLRGYGGARPMDPLEALTALLGGLGIEPARIPRTVDGAAALYRSLLCQRRVIVVLDDASTADQVRPLLPGNPACLVLITSRERLVGTVAREGARPVPIDALTADESWDLLSRLLGAPRVHAEPLATRQLAELCDHLPLALRIAAANLVNGRFSSVGAYVAEISAGDPLSELEIDGDEGRGVRAAFELSYAALSAPAQRLFRLLGVAPATELSLDAVAALADTAPTAARHLLRQLVNANLVEHQDSARFTVHNLLRSFGAHRLAADEPGARGPATDRLLHWYLARADAAVRLLYPQTRRRSPPAPGTAEVFGDAPHALAWLEIERRNLVVLLLAAAAEPALAPQPLIQLAQALYGFFYRRGYVQDWVRVDEAVLAVAKATGDRVAEARARARLGLALELRGQYGPALSCANEGLAISRDTGDDIGRHDCLIAIGAVRLRMGQPDSAEPYVAEGVAVSNSLGDRYGEALSLSHLGLVCEMQERYERAHRHHQRSLTLFRQAGCARGQGLSLHCLARLAERADHLVDAQRLYTESTAMLRAAGDRTALAHALGDLGRVHRRVGDETAALACLHEALPMCVDFGMRAAEAACRQELALARYKDAPEQAREHWHAALAILRDLGMAPLDEAEAVLGDQLTRS
jgi:DNA-binding SARP family transcriptional activator/tetratricopeptide (TPR) repeat protein